MQEKILKNIIVEYAGNEAEKLVDLLFNKQNVNEFLIAKKMNLTINQTRNTLYKLADHGLVRFVRKKDKKKGGWYTYFWTLNIKRCLMKYKEKLEEEKNKLNSQLESRKKERYYYSPLAELEYTEEQAILNDYMCPETGEVLELKDNSADINKIQTEITKIENVVKTIDTEIAVVEEKEEKVKEKRLKLEKKLKDEERAKKKAERDKEKKKLEKTSKKDSKKKPDKRKDSTKATKSKKKK